MPRWNPSISLICRCSRSPNFVPQSASVACGPQATQADCGSFLFKSEPFEQCLTKTGQSKNGGHKLIARDRKIPPTGFLDMLPEHYYRKVSCRPNRVFERGGRFLFVQNFPSKNESESLFAVNYRLFQRGGRVFCVRK